MKKLLLFILVVFLHHPSRGQQTTYINWSNSLGGTKSDVAWSIDRTQDGNYIVAGAALSFNGEVLSNHGGTDVWVLKLALDGNILWQKSYGSVGNDVGYCIKQTSDGGYIFVGAAGANGGDVSGYKGGADFWIVKIDASGTIQWQKCLGGSQDDIAHDVIQTYDGGYIVAGESASINGDLTGIHNNGGIDCWIVKLTSDGTIQWKKLYGGSRDDHAYSIRQLPDSGYIVAGQSISDDGDLTNNYQSGGLNTNDCWLFKINSVGDLVWQRTYGGSGNDVGRSIILTADNGNVIAGQTSSNDNDVSGNHGNDDFWVFKIDSVGRIQWEKTLGGTGFDEAYAVRQTTDSGYIVAGTSNSNDGDVTNNHGSYDYWIVKLNASGTLLMQKTFGGTGEDYAYSIVQAADQGFVVAGSSNSVNGDVGGNHGDNDYWVIDLVPIVGLEEKSSVVSSYNIYPNPALNSVYISFALSEPGYIKVKIVDVSGREIKNLAATNLSYGLHHFTWDMTTNTGCKTDDGIYFITLETPDGLTTRKLIVMKY